LRLYEFDETLAASLAWPCTTPCAGGYRFIEHAASEIVAETKPESRTQQVAKRSRGPKSPQPERKQAGRKADIYTEHVTLQMSAEMRDELIGVRESCSGRRPARTSESG
jgi:hypothetical protein